MDASPSTHSNTQLRQERIGRNWRQQDLADQVGTTVVTVKRWERGSQQPSAYFRVKLCALFGKSAEELGLLAEEPPHRKKTCTRRHPRLLRAAPLPSRRVHPSTLCCSKKTLLVASRTRMLRRLRRTYRDQLDQSLQGIAWMELGLANQPDAVHNARHLLLRFPQREEQLLPAGLSRSTRGPAHPGCPWGWQIDVAAGPGAAISGLCR